MNAIDRPGIVALVAIGAAAATFCDAVHVHTGTISYPDPWLFGQAWWVLPGFALTFVAMTAAYLFLAGSLAGRMPTQQSRTRGSAGAFVEALCMFVFVYVLSGFGSAEPALLSWLFLATFLLRWTFSYERAWLLTLALLMAIGGMIGEGLLNVAGLAAYRHSDVFHVPLWLGGLYLHGAFSLREGMRCLVYR